MADAIGLRHRSPAFRDAELTLLGAQGAALAFLRRAGEESYAVVVNAGDEPLTWELALPFSAASAELVPLRGGRPGECSAESVEGALRVKLPGREGVVVRLRA